MMSHATFRQLEVFEAIARLGSFTRASEELHLTQPTVSMQMKKLTDAVGLPLFEQVGRRIHLTEAGKELAIAAREIMQSLERCDMSIAEMRGLKKGKLRLAVVSTAKYFVPRILGEFLRQHPGVEVSLKVTNRQRVLERAAENLDDLYILSQPVGHIELVAKSFMENPLLVMAHPEHPLTHERNIPLQRIAQEPFLMREEGSGTRLSVERIFGSQGLKPNIRMELGSNEAIKQAIIGGLGISILSRHTLGMDGMGEPVVLDVEGFPVVNQWHIGHPHGKQLSVVASAFLDYLLRRMMKSPETSE
ncbi:LysR family transcriptional regulator [Methylobacillus sp. MM3]|jgi:DNA-binding transcriptional LysR family regulator|uniref:LysR family transcriptional regulator n=1 Tax=Methylobacillus sp. MM3 TaxID=1848039 RepID=UPI0007DF812D|nr:LysR family transcriptional regulator [Methylobacillus sp. MM3]OAJ71708.1 LysR family transcriptional regulator [Methylobacillus sp. MM3]